MIINHHPGRFDLNVPSSGSTGNITINDVIGNRNDNHSATTIYGRAKLINEHTHGISNFYPSLASNITLTAGATNFSLGAITTIISSGVITSDFDLHFVYAADATENGTYALYLYQGSSGSETKIAETRFNRSLPTGDAAPVMTMTPVITANSRISGAIATSTMGAASIGISLGYHTY